MKARAAFALASAASAVAAAPHALGDVVNITCAGAVCALWAAVDGGAPVPLRLSFYAPNIVRWWLAIDGNFSDVGAAADVIVGGGAPVTAVIRDAGAYYEITQAAPPTPDVVARVGKSPVLLTLLVGGKVVAQEASPLSWNSTSSWQTLARDAAAFPVGLSAEYYFGGGMQHGRFSHRDETIDLGGACAERTRGAVGRARIANPPLPSPTRACSSLPRLFTPAPCLSVTGTFQSTTTGTMAATRTRFRGSCRRPASACCATRGDRAGTRSRRPSSRRTTSPTAWTPFSPSRAPARRASRRCWASTRS